MGLKTLFHDHKKNYGKVRFTICMEGRGQTMRGSGQDMIQNDQIQRASVYMM